MHEMQPIKNMETLLQPLQIKFIVHMRMLSLADGVTDVHVDRLCVGIEPSVSNELFTERSSASAVKLIECHRKFNLNIISSNRRMLTVIRYA